MNDFSHLRREEVEAEKKSLLAKDVHSTTETGKELLERIKHIGSLI